MEFFQWKFNIDLRISFFDNDIIERRESEILFRLNSLEKDVLPMA
jgi:hypothetical protein